MFIIVFSPRTQQNAEEDKWTIRWRNIIGQAGLRTSICFLSCKVMKQGKEKSQ